MKRKHLAGLAVMGLVALSVPSHASTLSLAGTGTMTGVAGSFNLIYDADKDITWLDYTNGAANWSTQQGWAVNLVVTVNGVSYDNWRLPSTVDGPYVYGTNGTTTAGYNITTSEMGHLFYTELGNKGYFATDNSEQDYGLTNKGLFANLVPSWYWSGTKYAATANDAWVFYTAAGLQGVFNAYNDYRGAPYALAVLPGQIQSVPEPASTLLIGSGLAGLLSLGRKRRGH